MASQITPPSSSPTRSDLVHPNTAGPVVPHQNAWSGSCPPPPKRRRKEASVGGEPEVIDLGDDLTPGREVGSSGQFQQSEPAPAQEHNAASYAHRPLTRSHVRRPLAHFTQFYRRASNPVGASEPPSTTFHDGRHIWGRDPSWLNTAAPPPSQPVWSNPAPSSVYTQEEQPWMNPSDVNVSPVNPVSQQYYLEGQPRFQPQEQPWSGQMHHAHNLPTQPSTFVPYASQVHQIPVAGTAGRPILLDDEPIHPGHIPALQDHQVRGDGIHSQARSLDGGKENNYDHLTELGLRVTYDPKTGLPNGAARHFSETAPAAQTPGKVPQPGSASNQRPDLDPEEPKLCAEQAELVSLIENGHNVFYTGSAGCGKSTVLKAFVRRLRDSGKKVRIIAPTGRAALNVGGTTTWTFAGWTPSSHKLPIDRIKQGAHGKNVYKRLSKTDVLVIDEISMVENLHLERLNILMKTARYDPKLSVQPAFGGCQVVVTGDFCQLPPVKPFQHCLECGREMNTTVNDVGKLVHVCKLHGEYADEDKWAFKSNAWRECNFVHFHLKTIHRQNDQKFIRMLQKCRLGDKMKESEISLLMNHKCRVSQATKLYSTRKEANEVNRAAFNQLKGVKLVYWCHDSFFWRECHPQLQRKGMRGEWGNESEVASPPDTKRPLYALEDHRWAKCVELKRGMLVVLLTNLDLEAGLCNGSQGVICSFEDYDPKKMPMKERYDSRGRKVEPQPGQRVVRGEHAAVQEGQIKDFITSESAPIKRWPVVQFHNGRRRTVYAECSISQLGDEEPYSLLARTQIPLAPAWAMTIHKSQSLTMDRVIVNLSKAFEDGQVYVALSRATGLSGLKIEGDGDFLRNKLMVNSEVAAFLKEKFGDIYGATESEDEDIVTR